MDWLRLWHDMPTDPKFRSIAKSSKQPLAIVISVYVFMLVDASKNTMSRGVTLCHNEDIASALDLEIEQVEEIKKAMQKRLLAGNKLIGWEKRQPKKEDETASERKRAQREREKQLECHAMSQNVTTDKIREEERREDKNCLASSYNPAREENVDAGKKDFESFMPGGSTVVPSDPPPLADSPELCREVSQMCRAGSKPRDVPSGAVDVPNGWFQQVTDFFLEEFPTLWHGVSEKLMFWSSKKAAAMLSKWSEERVNLEDIKAAVSYCKQRERIAETPLYYGKPAIDFARERQKYGHYQQQSSKQKSKQDILRAEAELEVENALQAARERGEIV